MQCCMKVEAEVAVGKFRMQVFEACSGIIRTVGRLKEERTL